VIEAGLSTVSATDVDDRIRRVVEVVREIAIGGLAGLLGGVLVVGFGGRIFMRIVAAIDPTSIGLLTSNGNRIGDVTLDGTAVVVIVGAFVGAFVAVVWVVVSPWVPGTGALRAVAAGVVTITLGSFFVVRVDESDFTVLEPARVVIALLVGLVGVLGLTVAMIDAWLRRRLPPAGSTPIWALVVYWLLLAVGLLLAPFAIAPYFTGAPSAFEHPFAIGLALLAVGALTLARWAIRVWAGPLAPPRALLVAGRGALAIGVLLGTAKLATEISTILASPAVR
jgi:hypothetical protein